MREVGYQDCLENILSLWPNQLQWKNGDAPYTNYYIKALVDCYDNIDIVIDKEEDEVKRNFTGAINFCIFSEFHRIIKIDIDSGVNFGTFYKIQLDFDYIKTNFSEHLDLDFYKEFMAEFNIVVTQMDGIPNS